MSEQLPSSAAVQTDDEMIQQTKLDHLGPIIVNIDGTLQRIANWTEMNETEQASAVRLITARNKKRLQALNDLQKEASSDTSPPHSHRVIHQDLPVTSISLPFIDELLCHISSTTNVSTPLTFPIMYDPRIAQKALICGMFVVRPSLNAWSSPLDSNLYAMVDEWAFNYKGFDGGWLIANQNVLDAFRLALQYGTADAVIVSSMTVAMEGVDKPSVDRLGYIWQPYAVTEWPHLKAAFPSALELITKQRLAWQQQGYLPTSRKYPAQIIYTESGEKYPGSEDFLSARIFTAHHPSGEPIECYIMTGARGARCIRERILRSDHLVHLRERIDEILIVLPGKKGSGYEVEVTPLELNGAVDDNNNINDDEQLQRQLHPDIGAIPHILYQRYGMHIVNHDGGQQVLRAFARAGALAQVNLTMCRQRSLKEVLEQHMGRPVDTEEYQEKVQLFFSVPSSSLSSSVSSSSSSSSSPPSSLPLPAPSPSSASAPSTSIPPVATTDANPSTTTDATASTTTGDIASTRAVATVAVRGAVPSHWRPVYALTDPKQDVVVVTFDTSQACDF